MQIQVNGETQDVEEGISISTLLETLNVDAATVVVQQNDEIIAREKFAETHLNASDTLELIRFVGGG